MVVGVFLTDESVDDGLVSIDKCPDYICWLLQDCLDGALEDPLIFQGDAVLVVVQLMKFIDSLTFGSFCLGLSIASMAVGVSEMPQVEPLFEYGGYHFGGPSLTILLVSGPFPKVCMLFLFPVYSESAL